MLSERKNSSHNFELTLNSMLRALTEFFHWDQLDIKNRSISGRDKANSGIFSFTILLRKSFNEIDTRKKKQRHFRWLQALVSTFQDVDFDVSLLPLVIKSWYNHGIKKMPNHCLTRYHFHQPIYYTNSEL